MSGSEADQTRWVDIDKSLGSLACATIYLGDLGVPGSLEASASECQLGVKLLPIGEECHGIGGRR
uniref:Uncharacterized protein n=1 Tax=Arundo donax TaxID=35708 RepID=A0A0A9CGK5_ARUDO